MVKTGCGRNVVLCTVLKVVEDRAVEFEKESGRKRKRCTWREVSERGTVVDARGSRDKEKPNVYRKSCGGTKKLVGKSRVEKKGRQ